MDLGQIAASTTTTLTINFLPQYIKFNTATTPTALKVSVAGEGVIVDLDDAALDQINGLDMDGLAANDYVIALADGLVRDKVVTITMTNATAVAFNVYGWSKTNGLNYFTYERDTILANSGAIIKDFAALAIVAMGADDTATIEYQSGVSDTNTRQEIAADVGYFQNNVGSIYLINNLDAIVKSVNVIPSAQRTAVVLRFKPVLLPKAA